MCLPLPKLFQNEMSELLTNQNFEIKTVELSFPAERTTSMLKLCWKVHRL